MAHKAILLSFLFAFGMAMGKVSHLATFI